jgi:hypothetical protein
MLNALTLTALLLLSLFWSMTFAIVTNSSGWASLAPLTDNGRIPPTDAVLESPSFTTITTSTVNIPFLASPTCTTFITQCNLTRSSQVELQPAWSRDGQKIAFSRVSETPPWPLCARWHLYDECRRYATNQSIRILGHRMAAELFTPILPKTR